MVHLRDQTRGLLAQCYLALFWFLPNIKIEYKPGATNVAADELARVPTQVNNNGTTVTVVTVYKEVMFHSKQN